MSAGKGDKPRPVNFEKFSKNWDIIDWKKKEPKDPKKMKKILTRDFDDLLKI
jgi:hypothetical protein